MTCMFPKVYSSPQIRHGKLVIGIVEPQSLDKTMGQEYYSNRDDGRSQQENAENIKLLKSIKFIMALQIRKQLHTA